MHIIDFIMRFDKNNSLYAIAKLSPLSQTMESDSLSDMDGKTPELIFGKPIKGNTGSLELNARFFHYQKELEPQGFSLYLSHSGILKSFYEQALNHVYEGIQIYDRNGYFIFGNHASEALGQYANNDFKGKHILDLYDLREEFSTVLTVLRTQKPVLNRCDRFQVHQGKTLTTINSGYPINGSDSVEGAVVFESDLSTLEQTRKRLMHLETYSEERRTVPTGSLFSFDDIIHRSDSMKDVIHFSKKVSFSDSSILISGETGTGKELIAQSVHNFSPRRHKPFIDVNCSAVPSNLFESLFFGTEKGAFTGSVSGKGYFEMADGGTLFLDEVNSIPPDMQAKLLRTLQDKRFQRIGGAKPLHCDVRVIAASNENLETLITENRVRKDFYYRISTFKIELPRLEERPEDIPLLAMHFLDELKQKYHRTNLQFADATLEVLYGSQWPGNIRELQHVIEYSFTRINEDAVMIEPEHLPGYLQTQDSYSFRQDELPDAADPAPLPEVPYNAQLMAFERELFSTAFAYHNGNISKAAKALGMSRQNLQYHLKKHELID